MSPAQDVLPQTVAALEDGLRAGWHRGAQLYVSRHGRPLVDHAFGEGRLGVPMQPNTITLWLSAGKPITAIAIAQLVDAGQLRFDDPVCRHIPEFATGGKQAVTIRHLLTHTGGLRDADKIPEMVAWEETVQRVCATPLEPGWVPGWQAGYHRSGSWFILGEIVARRSGVPVSQYVRERVFEPLGLRDSWMSLPPAVFEAYRNRIGFMYLTQHGQNKPHPHWNSPSGAALCRPGSNVRGPIRELGRCYEFLLAQQSGATPPDPNAARVLKPETAKTLTSRQTFGLYDETLRHPVNWGLGFYVQAEPEGDEPVPYGYGRHASRNAFGHSGAQSSCAFADPDQGLVVAWLCNGLPGEPRHQARAWRINNSIYQDLAGDRGSPAGQ